MLYAPATADLENIPNINETATISAKDKIIYAHFLFGKTHWFISEFDKVDTMFGFAVLDGDLEMAEWGYVGLEELKDINVLGLEVIFDFYWKPKPAREVELICRAQGWPIIDTNITTGGESSWLTLPN